MNTKKLAELYDLYQTHKITEKEYLVLLEASGITEQVITDAAKLQLETQVNNAIVATLALIKTLR